MKQLRSAAIDLFFKLQLKWTLQILSGLLVEEEGGEKRSHLSSIDRLFCLKKLQLQFPWWWFTTYIIHILLQYDNCRSSIIGKHTILSGNGCQSSWFIMHIYHQMPAGKKSRKLDFTYCKVHLLSLTNTIMKTSNTCPSDYLPTDHAHYWWELEMSEKGGRAFHINFANNGT